MEGPRAAHVADQTIALSEAVCRCVDFVLHEAI